MKQPRKHLLCLLLALLLTGVLLAGCAADTADANADLPVITVGCDNYPPFTYVDSDGKPVGIDVELADEAFRRMGYRPEFVTINWAEKNELLENGVIDCIWSSFSMSGRADEYTWAGAIWCVRDFFQQFFPAFAKHIVCTTSTTTNEISGEFVTVFSCKV